MDNLWQSFADSVFLFCHALWLFKIGICHIIFSSSATVKVRRNRGLFLCETFKHCEPQACKSIEIVTQTQLFSCEFCKIFTNTYFYRTPLEVASETSLILCLNKIITLAKKYKIFFCKKMISRLGVLDSWKKSFLKKNPFSLFE